MRNHGIGGVHDTARNNLTKCAKKYSPNSHESGLYACRDIARLADVLGHSSIETTRIYLISSGIEHAKTLEALRLIL